MQKSTKLVKAKKLASKHRFTWQAKNDLYDQLTELEYLWDSRDQAWVYLPDTRSAKPDLIRLRVWAELSEVDLIADDIIAGLTNRYALFDRTVPIRCQSPMQSEGKVYLKFKPI